MTTVTLEEAQARLTELLHGLRPGEELVITDHGAPLARMKRTPSPSALLRPPPGLGRGMVTIVADDDDHLRDFAEYVP